MNLDFQKIFSWLKKDTDAPVPVLMESARERFVLKLENLEVGYLECKDGLWYFRYADDFKRQNEYHHIIGFSDKEKEYVSETLWPFFQIRIPGLGQPAVQDILSKEKIDAKNEVALLKRFGFKSISNPFTLSVE